MSGSSSSSSRGIGFSGLLTVALVVLKILGYIDWSWWLIFAPVLVSAVFFIAILALAIWLID